MTTCVPWARRRPEDLVRQDKQMAPGYEPMRSRCSRCSLVQQPGFDQSPADALDLGGTELDQRWAHYSAWEPAKQHQGFFHAVVHVDERVGVEGAGERVDAVVHRLGCGEVVGRYGAEYLRLQISDDAAGAGQQALTAEHQRREQPR